MHTLVAYLTILHGVVVANHVNVEEVLDLFQWHDGVLGIKLRAAQVGILTREGNNVHVEWWAVLRVVSSKGDNGGSARSIVVCTCIKDLLSQIAQMVIMGCEDIATVVSLTFHLCNDIEALVVLQEFVVDIRFHALYSLYGFWCRSDDGLVHHAMTPNGFARSSIPAGICFPLALGGR